MTKPLACAVRGQGLRRWKKQASQVDRIETVALSDEVSLDLPPILASYERHLKAVRALSTATTRNYVADLIPFCEYLGPTLGLGHDARLLRRFVERHGDINIEHEYRGLVRSYVAWLLEHRILRSGRDAGRHGHSRASVHRMLAALRGFARFLIESKNLPDAPIWHLRSTIMARLAPKTEQRLPDLLSKAEAGRLVEAPNPPATSALRDKALLELLYGCGLRVSEASNLDIRHVSLNERQVRVLGKGSKERQLPVGARARDALLAYMGSIHTPNLNAPLFRNTKGQRLGPRSIQHIVRKYAMIAGLRDDVHPHTLRHSYATHLLDGAADLRVVQELLGHSSPTATQVYTHVSQAEARRVYLSAHPLARDSDTEIRNETDPTHKSEPPK
jgi:site-specific recombinase XerD